jgi:hypothetical protein
MRARPVAILSQTGIDRMHSRSEDFRNERFDVYNRANAAAGVRYSSRLSLLAIRALSRSDSQWPEGFGCRMSDEAMRIDFTRGRGS